MIHNNVAASTHYQYSGAEAEFGLYNFHSQAQIDDLVDVLVSKKEQSTRVIQLVGERGSGRHYLLRAAAHHAFSRGINVAVEELTLDAYEPDTPLRGLLEHLSRQATGTVSEKLNELGKRTKVE